MATLPSGLPENVGDDEDLARFLPHESLFTAAQARPAAFLPNPKDRETSVSRHGREPTESLWELGIQAAGQRHLYGAAIVKARVPRASRLTVGADEPPPRHAVLRNWAWLDDEPYLDKAKRKEIAAVIAGKADLILR